MSRTKKQTTTVSKTTNAVKAPAKSVTRVIKQSKKAEEVRTKTLQMADVAHDEYMTTGDLRAGNMALKAFGMAIRTAQQQLAEHKWVGDKSRIKFLQ